MTRRHVSRLQEERGMGQGGVNEKREASDGVRESVATDTQKVRKVRRLSEAIKILRLSANHIVSICDIFLVHFLLHVLSSLDLVRDGGPHSALGGGIQHVWCLVMRFIHSLQR